MIGELRRRLALPSRRPLHRRLSGVEDPHPNEVLRCEAEIRRSIEQLGWEHPTRPKVWDLLKALRFVIRTTRRRARILDAGCVGSPILEFLHADGYRSLYGCDLSKKGVPRIPGLTFRQGDMTRTPFPSAAFEAVTCLSAVEHGVPREAFLAEMSRLLAPGGHLLLSTDYHEPKLGTDAMPRDQTFGLPWTIFSRSEIEELVRSAEQRHGLALTDPIRWDVEELPVHWKGWTYTFIFLAMRRV